MHRTFTLQQFTLWNTQFGPQFTAWRRLLAMLMISSAWLVQHSFIGTTLSATIKPVPGARRRHRRRNRSGNGSGENVGDDTAASYARYSSQMQSEEGIPHQHRKSREAAITNGHSIPTDLEFSDEAVSGTKREREGLNRMLAAAENGDFSTLYVYSLSRLARESVITLPMLKRLVYKFGVRVVSVVDGLDSAQDGWELVAHVIAIVNEQFIKELRASVLRGQEGAVLDGFSVGDYRFGYSSVPVSGSGETRCERSRKPRKVYVIEEQTAQWVLRIFEWFVEERRSITWIVRELNRRKAPKDHRSSTPEWRHELVVRVLECEKYIGVWPWRENTNVRDPETGKVRQVPRDEEESARWTRHLPHLQIIDEETFELAQRYLDDNEGSRPSLHRADGRFCGSRPDKGQPRHLLSGLIVCHECGRKFHVGGTHGKYLFCPGYRRGLCTCKTQLRRDRAERMILDTIGQHILGDAEWRQAVYKESLAAWRHQEQQFPQELASAQRHLAETERKIGRLLDRIESGFDDPEVNKRLKDRRNERQLIAKNVKRLRRLNECRGPEPTEDWVGSQLAQLGEALNGDSPAAAIALSDLVGGRIVVEEIRREGRKRHYLQGRFAIHASSVASAIVGPSERNEVGTETQVPEFVVDFVDPDPNQELLTKVFAMHHEEQMLCADIARQIGCSRSRLTKLLEMAYAKHGLSKPDGRSRRSTLPKKHVEAPLYMRIADEVKRLCDEGLLLGDIAERLGVDRNTITSAIRFWHESRKLEPPDGRTRRRSLDRISSQHQDDDHTNRPEEQADSM